eukprot:scaffold725_cov162-Ochromonas_danica.AAC.14
MDPRKVDQSRLWQTVRRCVKTAHCLAHEGEGGKGEGGRGRGDRQTFGVVEDLNAYGDSPSLTTGDASSSLNAVAASHEGERALLEAEVQQGAVHCLLGQRPHAKAQPGRIQERLPHGQESLAAQHSIGGLIVPPRYRIE